MLPKLNLTHCTLTGVDESTDLSALTALSEEFPFAEWGFLYSPKRQGMPGRYPSVDILRRAFAELPENVRVALHVCGDGVHNLLRLENNTEDDLAGMVLARGGRVQLNFNQRREPVDLLALDEYVIGNPSLTVITQHNEANETVWHMLRGNKNYAVLFDASGGRGLSPAGWPVPLQDVSCGYAGGLGRDNLATELDRIGKMVEDATFWVDM